MKCVLPINHLLVSFFGLIIIFTVGILQPFTIRVDQAKPDAANFKGILPDFKVIMPKIQGFVADKICSNMSYCKFKPRHKPPTINKFPADTKTVLKQFQHSTLLVVAFDFDFNYYIAPLIHQMYSRLFADVRYCGISSHSSAFVSGIRQKFPSDVADYFEPLYLNHEQGRPPRVPGAGEGIYYCVNLALNDVRLKRPKLHITGVVMMQDDVLLSFWQFFNPQSFNISKSSLLPPLATYDAQTLREHCAVYSNDESHPCPVVPNPWRNAIKKKYRKPAKYFYKELENGREAIYTKCYKNLIKKIGKAGYIMGGLVDLFYLAERDFATVLPMFELAYHNQLYAEIAIPTIFHGCFRQGHVDSINMSGWIPVVDNIRPSPYDVYDSKRLMLHPFKMSAFLEGKDFKGNGVYPSKDIPPNRCLFCLLSQYSDNFFSKL